jgi:predicted O-linked N-acetylglucosamine transferase (SPINDLY family)
MTNIRVKKLKSETERLISIYNAGNLAELERAARRYIALFPEQGFGWKVLAVSLQKQRKYQAAVEAFGSALDLVPRDPELYNNLGVAHKELGNFEAAESAVRTALRLNPAYAVARNNLGNILKKQERIAESIDEYRKALQLEPRLAMAHNNLGNSYKELDRNDEALASYGKALEIDPGCMEANQNLGSLLLDMGRYEEALALFSTIINNNAGDSEVKNKLGNVLEGLSRHEEAEAVYRSALKDDPGHAGLHTNLGNVLGFQGRLDEAMTCYRDAIAAQPAMADPVVHLALASLPTVVPDVKESERVSADFNCSLDELEAYAQTYGWDLLGKSVSVRLPFNLSYRPGDHRELLSRYGDIAARSRREWFSTQVKDVTARSARPDGERIRLGIVSAHVRRHSVWHVLLRGILLHLDRTLFEVFVYHTGSTCDRETDFARSLADRFVQGPTDWLRRIKEDAPDILFYPDLAMEPATFELGLLRLAPLQVTTWGHPITSGLPEIDLYFSGELLEGAAAEKHYREELVLLPGTGACSRLMSFEVKPLAAERIDLPGDRGVTRFLICQRAMKFDPAFDSLYADIAGQAPRCHFWFVRDLKIPWASRIVEQRIAAAFQSKGLDPQEHVTWVDWIPGDQFWSLLEAMDVYLDTPAFSGYTTAWQAVHCGLPVVTLEGELLRQRLAAGLLKRVGVTDTIAQCSDEYTSIAASLATDREKRIELRSRLKEAATRADEDVSVIRALEKEMIEGLRRKTTLLCSVEQS